MNQHTKMQHWFRCRIVPGQFESEYAITGTQTDGSVFSLFAPKDLVKWDVEPTLQRPADALLLVDVWQTTNDSILIRLPYSSIESGQFVSVKKDQIETKAEQLVG